MHRYIGIARDERERSQKPRSDENSVTYAHTGTHGAHHCAHPYPHGGRGAAAAAAGSINSRNIYTRLHTVGWIESAAPISLSVDAETDSDITRSFEPRKGWPRTAASYSVPLHEKTVSETGVRCQLDTPY